MSFVHLHCHSEYSLLDGANRIDDLIRRAQELEQPALAITDHGNLHAAWEFQEKAKKAGIKPIIGMEAYVAPGDRRSEARAGTGASRTTTSCCSRENTTATETSSSSRRSATPRASTPSRASTASCSRKYSEGNHRLLRLHGRRGRARTCWTTTATARARRRQLVRRTLQGPLLPRGAGARLRGPGEAERARSSSSPTELGLPVVATNDAHFSARTTTTRTTCCSASGSARIAATPTACGTTAACTSRARRRSPAHFPDRPDVLENTLDDRRRGRRRVRRRSITCRRSRSRRASTSENELLVTLADGGRAASATAIRCRHDVQRAARLRARRHHQDGLRRLLPDRRGLHQGRARPRHSGRAGPRLGRRLARRVRARASRTSARSSSTCCSSAS